ncbi:MAG TPA: hypothetical protein VFQ45_09235 [Longimicrobium sp.]|nr:hypothetical protein [Longimicrobium sp.]
MLSRPRRFASLAAALLTAALAACSDGPSLPQAAPPPGDPARALSGACVILSSTRTYDSIRQLNGFGRILVDADNPSCAKNAAATLRDKLANTRAKEPGYFQTWLAGNIVAMVLAAADRIGTYGYMTPELDAQLQWVATSYRHEPEPHGCGRTGTDLCTDTYSAAAAGYAWVTAYWFRHNDPRSGDTRIKALDWMDSTFASVCIRRVATVVGDLCDGSASEIPTGVSRTLSLNEGQQWPAYGFGLMTSVAAAVLGYEGSLLWGTYSFNTAQKNIARGLFEETQRVVDIVPNPDVFRRRCVRPVRDSTGWALRDSTADCAGLDPFPPLYLPTIKYQPQMYALYRFYRDRLGYTQPPGVYTSSALFVGHYSLGDPDAFFGYGRYAFYGELGHGWWSPRRPYMPMDYNPAMGYIDRVDGGRVAHGWACDRDTAQAAVRVELTVGGSVVSGLANQPSEDAVRTECGGGTAHRFAIQLPAGTVGYTVSGRAYDYTYGVDPLTCIAAGGCVVPPPPTVQVVWVRPAESSWGPANTQTAAGHAAGGQGTVRVEWRDVTFTSNPAWSLAGDVALDAGNSWSATLPSPYDCHTFQVRATYFGFTSSVFTYYGKTGGYCGETSRMIWVQPSSTAGIGPPGALVAGGEARGAPAGTRVGLWYRNATLNGAWTRKETDAPIDANGFWVNDIPNADPYHQYQVYSTYDVITTPVCTYQGTNGISWC